MNIRYISECSFNLWKIEWLLNKANAKFILCHRFDYAVGASDSVLRREATVAIANGYNGIQMVKIGRIIFAIGSSYSNFSNN